jgi:ribosomal protein L3 glutamine methyltransferase
MSDNGAPAEDLFTLRDFLRYAVSRFGAAGLSYGQGTGNAIDEAAFLILESLHLPIDDINPFADARLTGPERRLLLHRIEERIKTRKPAAYLLKRAYVQGVPFFVDERVIVPRSFIGEILFTEFFENLIRDRHKVKSVLDLCTGSGCLAILAARVFPRAVVDAIELSPRALEVACINVDASGDAARITLYAGDLYAPVAGRSYDLILSNPPYVTAEAMTSLPPEFRHEPSAALAGGADGLDVVRRILSGAANHLTSHGGLLCEVGRGRERLERARPDLRFLWVDTAENEGEVFWISRAGLLTRKGRRSHR